MLIMKILSGVILLLWHIQVGFTSLTPLAPLLSDVMWKHNTGFNTLREVEKCNPWKTKQNNQLPTQIVSNISNCQWYLLESTGLVVRKLLRLWSLHALSRHLLIWCAITKVVGRRMVTCYYVRMRWRAVNFQINQNEWKRRKIKLVTNIF